MRRTIRENKYFIVLLLLFAIAGAILLFNIDKGDVLRWVNARHNTFGNYFFFYATYFGAELVPVIILLFFFVQIRDFILLAAANLATSITIQFLKRIVFSTYPRPKRFFEDVGEIVNVVEGVTLHNNFSFPSGHSASAFALFFGIALVLANKKLGILFFFLGLLVAFSRIYLVQHFFMDIYTGALIASIVTFLVYHLFVTRQWYHEEWARKSLIKGWNWSKYSEPQQIQ